MQYATAIGLRSVFERATTIRCNASVDTVMMYVTPWNGSCSVLCSQHRFSRGTMVLNAMKHYEPS
jgi:hypothetical protein